MNEPAEKYQDAEDARNVAILRERMTAEGEGLRESLAVWIEENTQHPPAHYTQSTTARPSLALSMSTEYRYVSDNAKYDE